MAHWVASMRGLALLVVAVCLCWTLPALATEKPHILILLADDLGWNDVGYHGSPIQTPHIDQIASAGIELDRFYVQPTCSPTRAELMTGKSSIGLGMYGPLSKNSKHGVPLGEKLLPEYLADLGYQAFMVGKWHLGKHNRRQLPNSRGFEHTYGSLTGGVGYWNKVHGGGYDWHRNGEVLREEGYITHLLVDELRSLIATRDQQRPNFMYVAFQAPHLPNEAPEQTVKKYAYLQGHRAVHAAMVEEMDLAIGEILQIYQDAGMLENTLVVFFSDNGGVVPPGADPERHTPFQKFALLASRWLGRPVPDFPFPGIEFITANMLDGGSDNAPLPGGKTLVREGGVRVPAAIWLPRKLEGGQHQDFFNVSDVLPTIFDVIGASDAIPDDLDGLSQLAGLTGGDSVASNFVVSDLVNGFAIYHWPWKLINLAEPELFHLIDDPLEQVNLAAEYPEVLADLQQLLKNWDYGEAPGVPWYDVLFDPDTFGGEQTRQPWLDDLVR